MHRGISVHIGLNYLDKKHYGLEVIPLGTCEQDAKDMQKIAIAQNFKSSFILLSENASREAVKSVIKLASEQLNNGDTFLLTYSGHGGFVPDVNGDEQDNLDETWCLYDGQLIDDELYELWSYFKEGVKIFVISDSCHSGTVARANPNVHESKTDNKIFQKKLLSYSIAKEVYLQNRDFYTKIGRDFGADESKIKASIKLFAACQDPQVSYTMAFAKNSIFTQKLKEIWDDGKFDGDYNEFFEKIKKEVLALEFLPTTQTPNLMNIGKIDKNFDRAKPFQISS
jgi:hypothetical protein